MINVWDYINEKGKVRLTDIDGVKYDGYIEEITDVGEEAEGGLEEDSLILETQEAFIVFPQSEIISVESI